MAKKKEQTKVQLIKRLSEVRIVEIACKSVGISRATYYRWLQDDPDFAQECANAIWQGTETISDLAESQIVSRIKVGDLKASTYWLEHHREEYKKPGKGPRGPAHTWQGPEDRIPRDLSDEEIDHMIKVMGEMKSQSNS